MLFRKLNHCLLVAATPRVGSNYLCELMASTGELGVPREYFNHVGRRKYDDPNYPSDLRGQLRQIRTTGRTPNGIAGVKMHPFQVQEHPKDLLKAVGKLGPTMVIRLRRRDELGRAISWVRASQTNAHRAGDRLEAEATYSREAIEGAATWLQEQDAWWDSILPQHGWPIVDIAYEDLADDPQSQIDRVASEVGVRVATVRPQLVTLRVQRDDLTEVWRESFEREGGRS